MGEAAKDSSWIDSANLRREFLGKNMDITLGKGGSRMGKIVAEHIGGKKGPAARESKG